MFTNQYPFSQYTLILIYDSWFGIAGKADYEKIGWIKAAELQIENNVICGSDTVSFYTSDAARYKELRKNLLTFKADLPKDVRLTIFDEEAQ